MIKTGKIPEGYKQLRTFVLSVAPWCEYKQLTFIYVKARLLNTKHLTCLLRVPARPSDSPA